MYIFYLGRPSQTDSWREPSYFPVGDSVPTETWTAGKVRPWSPDWFEQRTSNSSLKNKKSIIDI